MILNTDFRKTEPGSFVLGISFLIALSIISSSVAQGQTVQFQQGSGGYIGTVDTWFSGLPSETSGFPAEPDFRTALSPAEGNKQALIRFEGIVGASAIPQSSIITSALLEVWVASGGQSSGEPNAAYTMLVDWGMSAGFGDPAWSGGATGGIDPDDLEANSSPLADSVAFASGGVVPQASKIEFDITSAVQLWSDVPGSNFGLMFQSVESSPGVGLDGGNDLRMRSSDAAGGSGQAPRLTVEYCPADSDGLDLATETSIGTDPCDDDTDSDGLLDGFEFSNGFDPLVSGEEGLDPDADGLDNLAEQLAGTDPNDSDSDGDELLDGFELANGFDPTDPDEDSNGTIDGQDDADLDGLGNAAEQAAGTDPNDSDSDGDGLLDGAELGVGSFGPQQVISTASDRATAVVGADLDGDGDIDVLSASETDDKIAWYPNIDGAGNFGSQQVISTLADAAQSVFSSDLDGDGDVDVLSASFGDDKIAWYENTDGFGTFGPQVVISTLADGAASVFGADLDGDGDIDVLSASVIDNKVAWYENTNGLGSFGPQQVISQLTGGAQSVFATDLDGDGDSDVVAALRFSNAIVWYENTDGAGTFGPPVIISFTAAGAFSVFAADLDGDGDADVLSASASDDKVAWYENTDGFGSFSIERIITTSAAEARSVFASDLDRDGDLDVLSASAVDDKIAWYENTDGLGSFGFPIVISESADAATSVFATDVNGDGDMDVLSASLFDDKTAWYENLTSSDPLDSDSDNDGLLDGFEVANGFDPVVAGEEDEDPDFDGLDNLSEQSVGTDPGDDDSDADGLSDGDEVNLYASDPLNQDTDGDGVMDGIEVAVQSDPIDRDDPTLQGVDFASQAGPLAYHESFGGETGFPTTPEVDLYGLGALTPVLEGDTPPPTPLFGGGAAGWIDLIAPSSPGPLFFDNVSVETSNPVASGEDIGVRASFAGIGPETTQGSVALGVETVSGARYFVYVQRDASGSSLGWGELSSAGVQVAGNDLSVPVFATDLRFDLFISPQNQEINLVIESSAFSLPLGPPGPITTNEPIVAIYTGISNFDIAGTTTAKLLDLKIFANPSAPIDTDGDGLFDSFELSFGFDPLVPGEQLLDNDGDGLDNLAEQSAGTNPLIADTEGDGLLDGFEVANGFDPLLSGEQALDPDVDGLDNLGEQAAGTDPNLADSDGDSLTDGDEVNEYGSDPLVQDTDGDLVLDGAEALAGSDPLDRDDPVLQGYDLASTAGPLLYRERFAGETSFPTSPDIDTFGFGGFVESVEGGPPVPIASLIDTPNGQIQFVATTSTLPIGLTISAIELESVLSTDQDVGISVRFTGLSPEADNEFGGIFLQAETDTGIQYLISLYNGPAGPTFQYQEVAADGSSTAFNETTIPAFEDARMELFLSPSTMGINFHVDTSDWAVPSPMAAGDTLTTAEILSVRVGTFVRGLPGTMQAKLLGVEIYGGAPPFADEDGDGLFNSFEVANGFNPLVAGEESQDTDGDGLYNLGEQSAGTDPRDGDTDSDGLSDGIEVLALRSDPTSIDSDADSVADAIDNCLLIPNVGQSDVDFDSVGDECDQSDPIALNDPSARTVFVEFEKSIDPTVVGQVFDRRMLPATYVASGNLRTITIAAAELDAYFANAGIGIAFDSGTFTDYVLVLDVPTGDLISADWSAMVSGELWTASATSSAVGGYSTLVAFGNTPIFCDEVLDGPCDFAVMTSSFEPTTGKIAGLGGVDVPSMNGAPAPNDLLNPLTDLRLVEMSPEFGLSGNWIGQSLFSEIFVSAGFDLFDLTLDSDGVVTTGTYFDSSTIGSPVPVDSGQLVVDGNGVLSGDLSVGGFGFEIEDFALSNSGTFAAGVSTDSLGFDSLSVTVRRGDSYAATDLEGLWIFGGLIEGASPFSSRVTAARFDIGAGGVAQAFNSGEITSFHNGPSSECLDFGVAPSLPGCGHIPTVLTIDPVSGQVNLPTLAGVPAQMDAGKTFMVGVGNDQFFAGGPKIQIGMLADSTPTLSDLEGVWRTFEAHTGSVLGGQFGWYRGEISIGSDGQVLGGFRISNDGAIDTVIGGGLSDANGPGFSGTIQYLFAPDQTISNFAIDVSGNAIFGVSTCDDGSFELRNCENDPGALEPGMSIWLPEPAFSMQVLIGIFALVGAGRRQRGHRHGVN